MAPRITTYQREAAQLLSEGYSKKETARLLNISTPTLLRWHNNPDFMALVDELSVATSIATKAERLRIAKQVIRQKVVDGALQTKKDLLDWLKYVKDETTDEAPAININLQIANSFTNLPPELRPAAFLGVAQSLFKHVPKNVDEIFDAMDDDSGTNAPPALPEGFQDCEFIVAGPEEPRVMVPLKQEQEDVRETTQPNLAEILDSLQGGAVDQHGSSE